MAVYDSARTVQNIAQPRVIESASASTACQTCDSKFAYILTGSVLGVIALIALGLTLLIFAAIASSYERTSSNDWYGYSDGYGYDERGYDGDDYDDFDDFGWSDYLGETQEAPRAL